MLGFGKRKEDPETVVTLAEGLAGLEGVVDITFVDLRPGSADRKKIEAEQALQYGIVSFPRSGHNWLSRMLAEIIKLHTNSNRPAALGRTGGMGHYIGLKAPAPEQAAHYRKEFHPFPAVYGSHGSTRHYGYEPQTKCYLWRGFRAVWRSTKKSIQDQVDEQLKLVENLLRQLEKEPGDMETVHRKAVLEDRLRFLRKGFIPGRGAWWGNTAFSCFLLWLKHRWNFRKAELKVRYEDLVRDTPGTLRKITDHMGVLDIPDSVIEAAVRAGSRKNMLREQELYGSPNPFQTVNEERIAS